MANEMSKAADAAAIKAGEQIHPDDLQALTDPTKPLGVVRVKSAPTAIATVHPGQMLQALMERPDVDLDKVEKLFELQERYEENEARKAYYTAVSQFQAEVDPVIGHDSNVSYSGTHFDFTSLPKIKRTVQPVLAAHGLTLTWRTGTTEQGNPVVTAILTHEMGHSEDTTLSAPIDTSGGKNPIQGLRSAWSYLRRMTAESILGIATGADDDDDGMSAGGPAPQQTEDPRPPIRPPMPAELFNNNHPFYKQRIQTGKGTPAQLIAKLQTKYTLTDAQMSAINNMISEEK